MTQGIIDWSAGVPQGWGTWAPGTGPAAANQLAERLADGEGARARVREAVTTIDALAREGAYLSFGVWVPDRATGEPLADLTAELVVGPPGTPLSADAHFEIVRRPPPKARGVKVFHYDAAVTDVDAGRAVIVTTDSAQRRSGQVTTGVYWTVFPPGSHEAIRLSFTTPLAAVAEALAAQSIEIVNRVRVTLGDPA